MNNFTVLKVNFKHLSIPCFIRMSDHEEEKKFTAGKSLKLKRVSIEVDVSTLVKAGKLQTKSTELKRQERFLADYDKELDNIEAQRSEYQVSKTQIRVLIK